MIQRATDGGFPTVDEAGEPIVWEKRTYESLRDWLAKTIPALDIVRRGKADEDIAAWYQPTAKDGEESSDPIPVRLKDVQNGTYRDGTYYLVSKVVEDEPRYLRCPAIGAEAAGSGAGLGVLHHQTAQARTIEELRSLNSEYAEKVSALMKENDSLWKENNNFRNINADLERTIKQKDAELAEAAEDAQPLFEDKEVKRLAPGLLTMASDYLINAASGGVGEVRFKSLIAAQMSFCRDITQNVLIVEQVFQHHRDAWTAYATTTNMLAQQGGVDVKLCSVEDMGNALKGLGRIARLPRKASEKPKPKARRRA